VLRKSLYEKRRVEGAGVYGQTAVLEFDVWEGDECFPLGGGMRAARAPNTLAKPKKKKKKPREWLGLISAWTSRLTPPQR